MTEPKVILNVPSAHIDIAALVAALNEELEAQLTVLTISPEHEIAVRQYLTSDLLSIRFSLLADSLAIGDVWRVVRDNAPVCDLVIDLTTYLHFHASCMGPNIWDRLVSTVASAIAAFNHGQVKEIDCALDDTQERERFVTEKTAAAFVNSNPWLVTLFVLRWCNVVRRDCADLAKQAQRLRAADANRSTG